MSRQPKKSDLNKPWMRPRRDKQIITMPEYHLIVTEGTKTEPGYFEGLRNEINQRYGKGRINIKIEGTGRNTLSLVDRAQKYVEQSNNPIKHVWLVYDHDDFPRDNFDNTAHKCISLSSDGKGGDSDVIYHALWSNQCIELWFILHFDYYQINAHRDDYIPKLTAFLESKRVGRYEKNRSDIYAVLRPHLEDAIRNAEKLIKQHGSDIPSRNTPGTMVFKIFDYLSDYIKEQNTIFT